MRSKLALFSLVPDTNTFGSRSRSNNEEAGEGGGGGERRGRGDGHSYNAGTDGGNSGDLNIAQYGLTQDEIRRFGYVYNPLKGSFEIESTNRPGSGSNSVHGALRAHRRLSFASAAGYLFKSHAHSRGGGGGGGTPNDTSSWERTSSGSSDGGSAHGRSLQAENANDGSQYGGSQHGDSSHGNGTGIGSGSDPAASANFTTNVHVTVAGAEGSGAAQRVDDDAMVQPGRRTSSHLWLPRSGDTIRREFFRGL
jgi:hypothetical protein